MRDSNMPPHSSAIVLEHLLRHEREDLVQFASHLKSATPTNNLQSHLSNMSGKYPSGSSLTLNKGAYFLFFFSSLEGSSVDADMHLNIVRWNSLYWRNPGTAVIYRTLIELDTKFPSESIHS